MPKKKHAIDHLDIKVAIVRLQGIVRELYHDSHDSRFLARSRMYARNEAAMLQRVIQFLHEELQ